MKTESELNQDIIDITMRIHKEYPELSKFIAEVPVKIPNNDSSDVTNKSLKDYYDSLFAIIDNYESTHPKA